MVAVAIVVEEEGVEEGEEDGGMGEAAGRRAGGSAFEGGVNRERATATLGGRAEEPRPRWSRIWGSLADLFRRCVFGRIMLLTLLFVVEYRAYARRREHLVNVGSA